MKHLLNVIFLLVIFLTWTHGVKLVCYYDITSGSRVGDGKFTERDMELALHYCTHVIYTYASIKPKEFTLTVQNHEMEHEFFKVKNLKRKYPQVKFLLSISGSDNEKTAKKYLSFLKSDEFSKLDFIKSAMEIVDKYKFDGLSLDFPLPMEKPNPVLTYTDRIWHNFINLFKKDSAYNLKEITPKDHLTSLIQQLSPYLKERNGLLTLNVLPNVLSTTYFDIPEIIDSLNFVILSAFDFYTPERNPNQADLTSPTKPPEDYTGKCSPLSNIKDFYKYWHSFNAPRHKIIIGVTTYGRAWKMTKYSNSNGKPPVVNTDGPAPGGPQTYTPGLLSYPEICYKLSHDQSLTRVIDRKSKAGVYAFRPADSMGNFGVWISYEDPTTTGAKAQYVRDHNLGGVSIYDISLDDVHGECEGEKFPILKSINFKLTRVLT